MNFVKIITLNVYKKILQLCIFDIFLIGKLSNYENFFTFLSFMA